LSRSIVIAILAFSSLILANLALVGFLSYGPLSEKVVTEKLVQELNEARSLMREEFEANPFHHRAAQIVAPMLKKYHQFQAIVLLDSSGHIVHRETIHKEVVRVNKTRVVPTPFLDLEQSNPRGTGQKLTDAEGLTVNAPSGRMATKSLPGGVALEYDQAMIDSEVAQIRKELFKNLLWALSISILLLISGGIYVIHSYKRNKIYQLKARNADKLAYVGTLAAGLAHEIRNPLNSMNMNLQLIREDLSEMGLGQNTEIQDMFDGTSNEINRLSRLVSSFLAYARPSQLSAKKQSINPVVQELSEFLAPELEKQEINLVLNLSKDLPEILLDESQIRQALLNVVQNAIQVLEKGQNITITTRLAGTDHLLVIIEDEGPGIAQENIENIVKVFYSTKRGGTGLGLPIAQRIAEQHGGGMKIESDVGKGTRITFVLPQKTEASEK